MATFVPESTYVPETYSLQATSTTIPNSTNYGYNNNNNQTNCHSQSIPTSAQFYETTTPTVQYPKDSFTNAVKTEPKLEPNQAYSATYSTSQYPYYTNTQDMSAQNGSYFYSSNTYSGQWSTVTASCEDKSQYSKLNQYPTINTSQDLYSDANYTQLSSSLPQQQMPPLPTQISSSYTGYYNGHTNNFNYTQPIEQWIPTNQMNTTVQSSYVKSEPMGNNKTDLSSNSIISSDCILLNSSSSSSSTCSPNSGLNQNIQKTVQSTAINDSNSNYPSSNSSISSSRSSMSSLSSDAVNNKSSNEGYFNSSYFKLQGNSNVKCKPSQKISSSQLTHSLKRKYSDELTESSNCTVCERPISTYDGACDHCKSSLKKVKPTDCETNNTLSSDITAPASSPSNSNCSYTSLVSTTSNALHNFRTLVSSLLLEIERKRTVIRQADSELAMKSHFIELTSSIADFILKNTNTSGGYRTNNLNQAEFQMNRELMVAYTYLIDEDHNNSLAGCLNPYELRIKESLKKIYSNAKRTNKQQCDNKNADIPSAEKLINSFDLTDFNNQTAFPTLNLNAEELNYGLSNLQDCEMLECLEGLTDTATTTTTTTTGTTVYVAAVKSNQTTTELKMLHFLILLFTSFLSLNDFIHLNKQQHRDSLNVSYCQRFLLQLLDRLCEDRSVKTKILLSISEIEFY